MTISAISSASSNPYYADQNSARQAFSQLVSALQSGNLSAAQSAYSAFTQGAGGQIDPNSPFAQAIDQIGQDLQSGNIDAAQQALSSLQQTHAPHHRRHHHLDGATQAQSPSPTSDDPMALSAAANASSTNTLDVTA